MKRILIALALAGSAVLAAALPASASTHPHSTFIIIRFSDHGDGGAAGNCGTPGPRNCWANDEGQAFLTVTPAGGNAYTARLTGLEGSFATIPGQLAPNQSGSYHGSHVTASTRLGASSALGGSADYSFTASRPPSGMAVVTISGDQPRMSTWYQLAFKTGTAFGGSGITDYSLSYLLKCSKMAAPQTWTETSLNGDGNQPQDGNILGC